MHLHEIMSALKKWLERRRSEPKFSIYGPIGVYFTQQYLHVVQLTHRADGAIGFQSHNSLAYPGTRADLLGSPAAVRKLIRRAMRAGNYHGRQVVSAMPPEQVRVMSLSYPANGSAGEAGTIAGLMADRVDGRLQDYVIDYVPIRTSSRDGDRLALVAVSSLDRVNNYLDCLASAGLHVDFLEIGPLAIKRLIEFRAVADQQVNTIVVNIGDESSHITTISGRRLLADQEVQFCLSTVIDALSSSLELAPELARDLLFANGLDVSRGHAEKSSNGGDLATAATIVEIVRPVFMQLVSEIERAFLFANSESHGNESRKLFIVGGLSRCSGVAALLGSLAKIDVEKLGRSHLPALATGDNEGSFCDERAADMAVAVGLALRGISDDE